MKEVAEYIVVGSGCTGAQAAQTLVAAGKQVTMLDVGVQDKDYKQLVSNKDFLSARQTDDNQYRYLIGSNFEGIAWGKVGKGEQVTPPRKHMLRDVERLIPLVSDTFTPVESLGYGGLGIGWGIGSWQFSKPELEAAGLDDAAMQAAYKTVGKRIGISATRDDASEYTIRDFNDFDPSPEMDSNHQLLYKKYLTKKQALRKKGMVMGRAPLALITTNKAGRKKYAYRDMDFYSDNDKSAYRPWITVDELKKKANFTYIGNRLVTHFKEKKQHVEVYCQNTQTGATSAFLCKKLILAPGVLGSARIVLRSFPKKNVKLPLLCNPYSYVPCIQPALLGKSAEPRKVGFSQLSFFLDEKQQNFGASMASLYSYQSLMLFRMARQAPLDFSDTRRIMQYLSPAILIMGIHQPDTPSKDKYVQLVADKISPTGDALKATYIPSQQEQADRDRREKTFVRAMHHMGAHALKRIDPGIGSSIHYAGTLPYSGTNKPYTLAANGLLHETQHVYVADGSGFTYLPAKGLTFTLMANAHRTAQEAMR